MELLKAILSLITEIVQLFIVVTGLKAILKYGFKEIWGRK